MLFASLLAGLVLGVAAALVTEGLQARLRSADDVELLLNLRFLAAVPRLSRRQMQSEAGKLHSPADSLFHQPISAYSEAFRTIRNSLRRRQAEGARVIALGSTLPLEGKTTSSLTLARVMAMSGQKILLIDGDIRRAGIRRAMGRQVEAGIVEVLNGEIAVEEAIIADAFDGLSVLPVVKPAFTPLDLFATDKMRDLLAQLREQYDYIIIDTPPLLGVTDARTLASLADGVVLVVRWGHTPLAAVDAAIAGLEADQSKIIGAVLTMVDPHSEAMGALYYSHYYNEYYQR
jgi:capsular exopolysaccharide synthesis family protein